MEWVKTTAKTLPEAIDLALDNLGVDEAEAEIVVLEEPRPGLFGRMRGTARVEARVKPKPIRPKTDRGRGRQSRSESGGGRNRSGDRGRKRSRNRAGKGQGGTDRQADRGQPSGARGDGDRQDGGAGERRRSGRPRGREDRSARRSDEGRSADEGRRTASAAPPSDSGTGGRSTEAKQRARAAEPIKEASVEEVSARLRAFLTELAEAFGFDSEVTIDDSQEDVLVGTIQGQHGLLVGPKGRTLDAVQELARISCQRATPSNIRIRVDVGGYRKQRVEALTAFAKKAAENAVDNSVEVALEPMSAADRKVIHDTLSEDARVETRSVGTEPRRKVLVIPIQSDDSPDSAASSGDAGTDSDDGAASNGAVEPGERDELESSAHGGEES